MNMRVVEVGARDGLQGLKTVLSTDAKVRMIKDLVACGVRSLDVAGVANPKLVPAVADGDAVLRRCMEELPSDVRLTAIVPNRRGMARALDATETRRGRGGLSVSVWVHGTEAFSRRNMGCSRAARLEENREVVRMAAAAGVGVRAYVSGALFCPETGKVAAGEVAGLARQMLAMGPMEELVIADTLGRGTARDVREAIEAVRGECGTEVPMGLHLHNTFGRALGAVEEATRLGLRSFESSVAGLGGCPFAGSESLGNLATEDLVTLLHQMGFETGIDVAQLVEVGKRIAKELDVPVASCVGKMGSQK